MRARTTLTSAAALAAVVLGASACASEADDFADQSATEIRKDAVADMKKVKSMRIAGDLSSDQQKVGLDIAMDKDGNCEGSLEIGEGKADFVTAKDATYVKGDEAFWTGTAGDAQAKSIVALVGDKWAKLPAEVAGFSQFCDIDNFAESLADDSGAADVKKDGREDVDGTDAVVLAGKSDEGGGTSRAWVAAEGQHRILKLSNEGGNAPGEFVFSEFDEPVEAEVPAKGEIVDLSAAQ